ncbi:hypothetical protein [Bombella pollinis]|uniref:Uncharacterized protein n=1 Tax=Bombella pollinis TaxID=2967337 RepID=A0ABT3WL42_9PROT|nr:hypothetical protein [Bombella pollinis]MCX5619398.1 hypothetical protein [Bombella pollinis]
MTDNTPPRLGRRRPRPPRSLKQHIIRRLIVIVPAFFLMFIFVRTGALDNLYDRFTFNKLSWFDNTALVEHLRTVITRKGLTTMPRRCLVMVVNGDASTPVPSIDVLGRHGNGCPGTTPSAELLFHLRVDRAGQSIMTDAGSPGLYRPLIP